MYYITLGLVTGETLQCSVHTKPLTKNNTVIKVPFSGGHHTAVHTMRRLGTGPAVQTHQLMVSAHIQVPLLTNGGTIGIVPRPFTTPHCRVHLLTAGTLVRVTDKGIATPLSHRGEGDLTETREVVGGG